MRSILQTDSRIGGAHVVQQLLGIFTHDRLLVVAGRIMPADTIVVHIVQDRQTRLGRLVDIELGVIRLRDLLVARFAPRIVSPSVRDLVGGVNLLTVVRPEPTVDVLWLQIRAALAALEVAQTSRGPDVWHVVLLDQSEDQVVLLLRFQRHQIHAVLAADVATIQPVHSLVSKCRNMGTVEVVVSTVAELLRTCGWEWCEQTKEKTLPIIPILDRSSTQHVCHPQ